MLMITSIKVTVSHRRVIAGRLYNLRSGDVLDVAQYPGDTDADISAQEAAVMLDAEMAEEGEEREMEEREMETNETGSREPETRWAEFRKVAA